MMQQRSDACCRMSHTSNDVRFAGGRTKCEGRVEIYQPLTDTWGSVCDTNWDDSNAQVICRQQGLPGGSARLNSFYGPSINKMVMDNVLCTGTEGNIIECAHTAVLPGQAPCDNKNEAGVMCEHDIRIVGGYSGYEGRVEIYNVHLASWGSICGPEWGHNESKVICRQLGMAGGKALDKAIFEPGTDDISLTHVSCPTGNETDILQCQHGGLGNHNQCKHRDDVGVRCKPDMRIVDGPTPYEGRVEVHDIVTDTWGTVCKAGWDDNDAQIVCEYLGLQGGEAILDGQYPPGTGPIHLSNLECEGDEMTLLDCNHNGWGDAQCNHIQDAGVKCHVPGQDADGSMPCFIYRDGSVINFAGQLIPNSLAHGKNYVASMGFKSDPNDNPCKFAVMIFFDKHENKITWASLSTGVHAKNPAKYDTNIAFERRGATKQLESRGYLKPQTDPKTYISSYPYVTYSPDGATGTQIDKIKPFKGWKINTTCPYNLVYRFKKSHPAIVLKLRYSGNTYTPGNIKGICT